MQEKNYDIISLDYDSNLKFKNNFNSELDEEELEILKRYNKVTFGYYFNQKLTDLPYNVEELYLSECYNQPIDNLCKTQDIGLFCFFNSIFGCKIYNYGLKKLVISGQFDYPIDNLPDSIEYLTIIGNFNQPINKLPKNLSYLKIAGRFNSEIKKFSPNLKYLVLTNPDYSYKLDNIPEGTIKHIVVSSKYKYNLELSNKYQHCIIEYKL